MRSAGGHGPDRGRAVRRAAAMRSLLPEPTLHEEHVAGRLGVRGAVTLAVGGRHQSAAAASLRLPSGELSSRAQRAALSKRVDLWSGE